MGNILIVEDELEVRSGLVKTVMEIDPGQKVFESAQASKALEIAKTEKIDAFFLDIQLEDYSGLELARQIRELTSYKFTPIIFITAIFTKELEAFKNIHCYDYIIKPFSDNEIRRVFTEVIFFGIDEEKKESVLRIKNRGFTYVIKQSEIMYIESINRKLIIWTTHEKIDMVSITLYKMLELLSDQFIQCHGSFIVNRQYIRKVDKYKNQLSIESQERKMEIPIGRKFRESVIGLIHDNI